MLMDQSQSEKDKIIGWLVRAFGTRLGTKFIDDAEQLKRRTAALQRIQDHAYLEGGLYKAHLLTIVKTLVAPNSDGDGDHDWLRNKLTSLANQSAPKSVPALKKGTAPKSNSCDGRRDPRVVGRRRGRQGAALGMDGLTSFFKNNPP
ncbi:hypothetical protein JNO13_05975 [Pseudomonas sp. 1079]|nr:hypothetical protein [Pseudomonas sp. 1079]MBN1080326.1 hypothetical protein [Pseudomonas sp. 1079]